VEIIDLKYTLATIDELFPSDDEEGQNVRVSYFAAEVAARLLGVPQDELLWHAPDVFSVRYGSSYVASASANGKKVRFHSTEGDFKEGDDNANF
jgi:hypothetical protein